MSVPIMIKLCRLKDYLISYLLKMESNFSLVKKGDYYFLRKLSYPHLKAFVHIDRKIPIIKEIDFDDKCSVTEKENALKEAEIFLQNFAAEG